MLLLSCLLNFLIGENRASFYVERLPSNNKNGFINTFPNANKLCVKSYCIKRNGLCNDYSCCVCKCSDDIKTVYLGAKCVSSKGILRSVGATSVDKLHFMLATEAIPTKRSSQDIPLIKQPPDLEDLLFDLKLPQHYQSTSVEKCFAGAIYYIDFNSGLMKEYFNNTCQQMLKAELKHPTMLKLSLHAASDWEELSGHLFVITIKCLLSNKNLIDGLMVFQSAGTEVNNLPLPSKISDMNPDECDEISDSKDFRLLVGVLCGLSVLLLLVLAGIAYTCRTSQRNKRGTSTPKRQSCRENEYMQAALVAPVTEDGGGYLLPVECLPPSGAGAVRPEFKDNEEKTLLDSDGYVALSAVQKEALSNPS